MKQIMLAFIFISSFISCSKEEVDNLDNTAKEKDLIFVEELNCYMPKTFDKKRYIFVKELPDSRTMELMKNPLKQGSLDKPAIGGILKETYVNFVGQTGLVEEVSLSLPGGWIITGVGALINTSSNNYRILLLERRYVYSDGTMSERFISWDTERDYGTPSQCEVWCTIPDGCLAIGIGIKGKYDVTCCDLYYRYFNPTTLRLYGENLKVHSGTSSTYDIQWLPEFNFLDNDRTVLLGLGLVAASGGTERLSYAYGIIK